MAFIGQDQIPIVEDYRQIGGIPSVCISQNPKLACQTKTIAALPHMLQQELHKAKD